MYPSQKNIENMKDKWCRKDTRWTIKKYRKLFVLLYFNENDKIEPDQKSYKIYENSKHQNAYRTCRFLVFSVENNWLQRRSLDAQAPTPEAIFYWKTCTQVDLWEKHT